MDDKKPIPEEVALQICEEVRELNKKKKIQLYKSSMLGMYEIFTKKE